jgi:hypothetical protein
VRSATGVAHARPGIALDFACSGTKPIVLLGWRQSRTVFPFSHRTYTIFPQFSPTCIRRKNRAERWARWVHRMGMCWVGEKKISFLAETLFKLLFFYLIVLPPYPLKKHMTCGSGMRGKTDSIWVRKIFNYLRSL